MNNEPSEKEQYELNNLYKMFDSPEDKMRRRMKVIFCMGIVLFVVATIVKYLVNNSVGFVLQIVAGILIIIAMTCFAVIPR